MAGAGAWNLDVEGVENLTMVLEWNVSRLDRNKYRERLKAQMRIV
jgi:hypothetical protein